MTMKLSNKFNEIRQNFLNAVAMVRLKKSKRNFTMK